LVYLDNPGPDLFFHLKACQIYPSTNGARKRELFKLMARGGCKTLPPHTHSSVVTRSFSNNNVKLETTTTSNNNPQFLVEPVTPAPQGVDVQEIVHQSLIRKHYALAHIIQLGSPLNQPLDFSDIQEKLEGTTLLSNPLGDNTTNPTKTPTLEIGGSDIPPSPPSSYPSSSRGESSDEDSSLSESSQPPTTPTPMENQNNHARPWLDQDGVVIP
jgi:hypothetical protein